MKSTELARRNNEMKEVLKALRDERNQIIEKMKSEKRKISSIFNERISKIEDETKRQLKELREERKKEKANIEILVNDKLASIRNEIERYRVEIRENNTILNEKKAKKTFEEELIEFNNRENRANKIKDAIVSREITSGSIVKVLYKSEPISVEVNRINLPKGRISVKSKLFSNYNKYCTRSFNFEDILAVA